MWNKIISKLFQPSSMSVWNSNTCCSSWIFSSMFNVAKTVLQTGGATTHHIPTFWTKILRPACLSPCTTTTYCNSAYQSQKLAIKRQNVLDTHEGALFLDLTGGLCTHISLRALAPRASHPFCMHPVERWSPTNIMGLKTLIWATFKSCPRKFVYGLNIGIKSPMHGPYGRRGPCTRV